MNQKGLVSEFIVILIVVLLALGGYLLYQQAKSPPSPQPTIQPSSRPSPNSAYKIAPSPSDDNNKVCSDPNTNARLDLSEAFDIAQKSECATVGNLTQSYWCNGKWWIDIDAKEKKCNPACVVNPNSKTATVNWRCTGAIPSNP